MFRGPSLTVLPIPRKDRWPAAVGHGMHRIAPGIPTNGHRPSTNGVPAAHTAPGTRALTLTAIVPATDHPATLETCTAAIQAAEDSPEQLIVVLDAPHKGPASARNVGAAQATGDVLVFIDADVVVHPDVFSRIRRAFECDPGLAGAFGSYDADPAGRGHVSAFRNLLHHHVHQQAAGSAETFWSGLGAVRREVFLASGGFDARRFRAASVEDIEFGMRLSAAGRRIVLDPAIQGTHLKTFRLRDMVHTDFFRRGVPWTALLLRAGAEGSTTLNLGWRHRWSAAASIGGLVALLARRPGATLAAFVLLSGLNRSFYVLLLKKRGPVGAAIGVGLHALHHLTGVASVPGGLTVHVVAARTNGHDRPAVIATSATNGDRTRVGAR